MGHKKAFTHLSHVSCEEYEVRLHKVSRSHLVREFDGGRLLPERELDRARCERVEKLLPEDAKSMNLMPGLLSTHSKWLDWLQVGAQLLSLRAACKPFSLQKIEFGSPSGHLRVTLNIMSSEHVRNTSWRSQSSELANKEDVPRSDAFRTGRSEQPIWAEKTRRHERTAALSQAVLLQKASAKEKKDEAEHLPHCVVR